MGQCRVQWGGGCVGAWQRGPQCPSSPRLPAGRPAAAPHARPPPPGHSAPVGQGVDVERLVAHDRPVQLQHLQWWGGAVEAAVGRACESREPAAGSGRQRAQLPPQQQAGRQAGRQAEQGGHLPGTGSIPEPPAVPSGVGGQGRHQVRAASPAWPIISHGRRWAPRLRGQSGAAARCACWAHRPTHRTAHPLAPPAHLLEEGQEEGLEREEAAGAGGVRRALGGRLHRDLACGRAGAQAGGCMGGGRTRRDLERAAGDAPPGARRPARLPCAPASPAAW